MDQPQPRRVQFRLRSLLLAFVPVAVVALIVGRYLRSPLPVPVSGVVTLNGQPLDGATVMFFLIDSNGRAAVGTSDMTGRFQLQTYVSGSTILPGALPGSYRVTVAKKLKQQRSDSDRLDRPFQGDTATQPCLA
jgi:hypothetical protein